MYVNTQGLATKLVEMLIHSTLEHVDVSLPVALGAHPQIRHTLDHSCPSASLTSEQLKFTWFVKCHRGTRCFGRLRDVDVPMLFAYAHCVVLEPGAPLVRKNQVCTHPAKSGIFHQMNPAYPSQFPRILSSYESMLRIFHAYSTHTPRRAQSCTHTLRTLPRHLRPVQHAGRDKPQPFGP